MTCRNSSHHTPPRPGITILVMIAVLLLATPFLAGAAPLPQDPYQEGLRLSRAKNWEDAITAFQKAVSRDPKNALAHANLGVAFSQTGKYKQALLAFEESLNLGYDSALLRYNRGLSFARLNLLEEAAGEFEKTLEKDSRIVKAIYDLGVVRLMQNRPREAREKVHLLYRRNNKLAKKLFDQIPPDYKIVSLDHVGTLRGRVKLTGPVPQPRSFHLIHSPNIEFCSRISDGKGHRLVRDFTVSESSGLKDVVIAIQGVHKGKPYTSRMQSFNIARCHSDQYVIGIKNGEDFLIENTDPIRHEIATYEIAGAYVNQKSNRPVDEKTSQIQNVFVRGDVDEFLIKCNLHPFLQTRAFMVDNPYYTVTDSEGRFTIKDIPPGRYDVIAWHPFIPSQKGTITVKADRETQLDFEFNGKDEGRKLYEQDIQGYRFQPWYDSFKKFYGGPRKDDPVEILQKF